MGVVTVSSSASQTPIGLSSRFSTNHSTFKIPTILNFKTDKTENTSLATTHESNPLTPKTHGANKRLRKPTKSSKRVKVVATDDACVLDLDYTEAAAKLENIYKLSPAKDISDVEDIVRVVRRRRRTKKVEKRNEKVEKKPSDVVVRSDNKKVKRLGLDKRIALKRTGEVINTSKKKKEKLGDGDIDRLVRDYSASTDLVSLDWKKIKIPPVLPSLEHTWLFKLMQPMKVLLEVKEAMCRDLGRESSDGELATATNMNIPQVRRQIEVRRAARNKLIKHNLRLVLFVINKYFQEFANSTRFQDLCQAGARGLITAIDHFEPKRSFRLSTYDSISHGRHGRDWRHQKYRNHWRHWRHERHWRQLKMTVVEI